MNGNLQVTEIQPFTRWMKTRFPFRYGIASMTEVPHLFLKLTLCCDGKTSTGITSEGLPPKWFTKNPETTFEQDLPDLVEVIRHAADLARSLSPSESIFSLWRRLYDEQESWAQTQGIPPLLANLGVSLVERGLIDAFCRAIGVSFSVALRENRFGIDPGTIHPELKGRSPADFLPREPQASILVRHTVGLGDPLTVDDIPEGELASDGLPQALVDCIRTYGLRYFKIKLSGDEASDLKRMLTLAKLLKQESPDFRFTLDGNEQFDDLGKFRNAWDVLKREPVLAEMLSDRHLLFVEQPLHRKVALEPLQMAALKDWEDAPPVIIDESDAELTSLRQALEIGYSGTSFKSCKGVFKGIANACLLEHRKAENPTKPLILSGEDLATVGPVAVLQDLSAMAALGITHVERNGHHYFCGLSAFPGTVQASISEGRHRGLYEMRKPENFASLVIQEGQLNLSTVHRAPFGTGIDSATITWEELGLPGWPEFRR